MNGIFTTSFLNMKAEGIFDQDPHCCCTTWLRNLNDEMINEIINLSYLEESNENSQDFTMTIFHIEEMKRGGGTASLTEDAVAKLASIYIVGALQQQLVRQGIIEIQDTTVPVGMLRGKKIENN
jgi:hypothetical protein